MRIRSRHFPHPVLSFFSDDFPNCRFSWNVSVDSSTDSYGLSVEFQLTSEHLRSLIDEGKAHFAVHAECPQTYFRALWITDMSKDSFTVESDLLSGRVELCGFVIAGEEIRNYASPEFHPDFGGASFRVKQGDILAVAKNKKFTVDKPHDPLAKVPSIFLVTPNRERSSPPITYDATTDKIVIKLRWDTFERYKMLQASGALPEVLSSLILMPVLVSVIERYFQKLEGQDEISDLRWFQVIRKRLAALNVQPGDLSEDPVELVQRLVGEPLDRAVESLDDFLTSED